MKIIKTYICCLALFLGALIIAPVNAQDSSNEFSNIVTANLKAQGASFTNVVTGTVRDAVTNEPLPGINLNVTGIASAITEDDGTYSIRIPSKDLILIVDDAMYDRQDISIRGRSVIDIDLYERGYKGTQKTIPTPVGEVSSLTVANSWSVISEDNILSTAVTPEVLLQGYTSGVNTVSRSGMAGAGANVYIHGFNSIHGGTMPLIIVDGMPYENSTYATSLIGNYQANPLSSLDIKDIENITVLKDGTSLYGVKGANGVILINTIKAKAPETRINAHVHAGISFEPNQYPVLNAAQHKNLISEVYQAEGYTPDMINSLPFFDKTKPVEEAWGYEGNKDYYRYNHNTNWQDQVYEGKVNQNYYINITGGDDVALYMLSLGFLNQSGVVSGTNFQRFNTRFNSEIKLTSKLTFNANMSFVYGEKNLANEGPNASLNPILSSALKTPMMTNHFYNETGKPSPNYEDADVFGNSNPYVLVNNLSLDNVNNRFFGSFKLNYQFTKELSLSGLLGVNFNKEREKIFYPSVGVDYEPQGIYAVTNEMKHRVDRLFSLYGDVYLDYIKRIGVDQSLSVRAGLRYQNNKAENDFGEGYNSSSDDFKSINYGIPVLRQVGGTLGTWNWMSVYANIDYNLKNKYFFNFAISGDASSRYGEDAASMFVYPSIAGAWLLTGEEFMKDVTALDMLKLRVSYGLSGNDDIGNYNGMQNYVPQGILGAYGLIRGNLVNLKLKPEQLERINIGLDASILNERVNFSVDVYQNTVRDMILQTTPSRLTGFSNYIDNAGSMRNTGVDFSINSRIINNTFKWDLGLTVSHYKNEVLDLAGETLYTSIMGGTIETKVGQPVGQFYGYKTEGVYSTQADANAAGLYVMSGLDQVPFTAGDVRFANLSGSDKVIDENDMTVIGDPNPDIFGSISNTFKYKQWTLNALMTYSLGNDVYNYARSQMESLSTFNNQSQAVLNRWRHEGDVTNMPKISYGDPMGNARFSDRWIEDGSYLRLKSVVLSYDWDLRGKFGNYIQGCTFFATGENLVTFTKYKGLDPEFSYGSNPLYYGIDPCVAPQPRTVSIGIKLAL